MTRSTSLEPAQPGEARSWSRVRPSGTVLGAQASSRARDRVARGIVEGDPQVETVSERRRRFGFGNRVAQAFGQPVTAANDRKTHAALDQVPKLGSEILPQQRHQRSHLLIGSPPVVGRERKQRQCRDAEVGRSFDHATHGVGACAVPGGARQTAARCPAPVAVHDDGDVQVIFSSQSTLHCKVSMQKKGCHSGGLQSMNA